MFCLLKKIALKLGEETSLSEYLHYQCLVKKDFLSEHMFRVHSVDHIERNTIIDYFVIQKFL